MPWNDNANPGPWGAPPPAGSGAVIRAFASFADSVAGAGAGVSCAMAAAETVSATSAAILWCILLNPLKIT